MQGQNIVACNIFPEVNINKISPGIMNRECLNTDHWVQVLRYMRDISCENPALIDLKGISCDT